MKEFPAAKMDNLTKIMTWSLLVLVPLAILPTLRMDDNFFKFFMVVMIFSSVIIAYMLRPKYFMDSRNIYIKTKFKTIEIPIINIERLQLDSSFPFQFRTFGVGGLFGYFGYFSGSELWYVTNTRKKIKIKSTKRVYVISPENPQEFMDELNKFRHLNTQPLPLSQH